MAFVLRSLFQEFEDNFSFDDTLMGKHCCFFVVKDSQNSPTLPDFMSLSMFLANWHLQASGMIFSFAIIASWNKSLHSSQGIGGSTVWFYQNEVIPLTFDSLLFDCAMIKCFFVTASSTYIQIKCV